MKIMTHRSRTGKTTLMVAAEHSPEGMVCWLMKEYGIRDLLND